MTRRPAYPVRAVLRHDLARGPPLSLPVPRPGRGTGYVIRMRPAAWPEPDPQIASAITAMYNARKTASPLAVPVRDQPGEWLRDEGFATASGAVPGDFRRG